MHTQWKVHKEVKGPLCQAGEKKSMLIKFAVDLKDQPPLELRVDSELSEEDLEYKEQELEQRLRDRCLFPRSCEASTFKIEHYFEFQLTHSH